MAATIGFFLFLGLISLCSRESAEDKAKREDKERRITYMQEASWFYDKFYPGKYGAGPRELPKYVSNDFRYNDDIKQFRRDHKAICLRALALADDDYAGEQRIEDEIIALYPGTQS
jgi:hypothetical protein